MDIFDGLTMIGGICLFLFGMNVMGQALERRAGSGLRRILSKLTNNKFIGFLTGVAVTAVIQSSAATTVMVVGFVNSGLMSLAQSVNVIIGANVGTTVTSWILSLSGISGDNFWISLLKPTSFVPIVALVGIILTMFSKKSKRKETGMIFLGFATLMFGMNMMMGAVSGLSEDTRFQNLFTLFSNPLLGMLLGALLTAVIQSSSASVGILQALAITGQITYGTAIPIIMGQNIGTCITAIISSAGANKNAKRAALVHLSFNVLGTLAGMLIFLPIKYFVQPAIFDMQINTFGIAIAHTSFNILCTVILLPSSKLLEKLACKLIRDGKKPEKLVDLDERLFATPALAIAQCKKVSVTMAQISADALKNGIMLIKNYSGELCDKIREQEELIDHYEDELGSYLVKLSSQQIGATDSEEAAKMLKIIGDLERLSDHGLNFIDSAEEILEKKITLSGDAEKELDTLCNAVNEILDLAVKAYEDSDIETAKLVEPLEQVIDGLKDKIRLNHIKRLQQGKCTIEAGFVLSDILTDLERAADHCSNISGCVIDMAQGNMNLHESLHIMRNESPDFKKEFAKYSQKYAID